MNAFNLKILAIIGMTLDHVAIIFVDYIPYFIRLPMFFAGGITFPIMAYLFVEGYQKTSNRRNYAKRLFFFAILSIMPFYWVVQQPLLPILFIFLLAMVAIFLYEKQANRKLFYMNFILILILSSFCDWAIIGVCLIMAFWIMRFHEKKGIVYPLAVTAIFMFILSLFYIETDFELAFLSIAFSFGNFASILIILAYNGQRGRAMKYFFYIYYPLHLTLFVLLKNLL